ncbi:MAG TPA: ATP-binding protein [Ginsengibacter sp.]
MIKRTLGEQIKLMAAKMPVITITGPRQSGKTTLAKQCFPDYEYMNLENPDVLEFAKSDPRLFLSQHKKGIIIDEAQVMPELFSYIQTISDENNKTGEFILTGSQNFLMTEKISQSLAGRVFITHLLPFSIEEIKKSKHWIENPNHYIFNGFYPRIYDKDIPPNLFYPSYIQTYTERDIRQIINVSNLHSFQRFMRLVAGRTAQLLNYSNIANELGHDLKTIKSWFSILESSFIIFFLQPHHKNYSKRLVKTPKLFFYDTGLACSLLGIKNEYEINLHWAKGALFENLIISDIAKNYLNKSQNPSLFFWRDNTGNELDCLIEGALSLKRIEIKSASTIHPDFFKGLAYYNKLSNSTSENSFLIYSGNKNLRRKEATVLSWKNTEQLL